MTLTSADCEPPSRCLTVPNRSPVVCAVDVGSSYVKAAVYDGLLRQRGRAQAQFPVTRNGDRVEADLPDVWLAVAATIRAAIATSDLAPTMLALTTQMAGLVLLDGTYCPVGPYILGIDRRAFVGRRPDNVSASARTGCPSGGIYPADKLAWLAERKPARLAAARFIGGLKDYLLYRLCGVWVTDHSSASTTGLYDQLSGSWWREAVQGVGISASMLPMVVPGSQTVGGVLAAAADQCGLRTGLPVIAGLGDGPAASLAAGAIHPRSLCLSLGTTVVARLFVTQPDLPALGVPMFRQQVDASAFFIGCRFDAVDGAFTLVGSPGSRLDMSEFSTVMRAVIDRYGVREIRPTGSRSHSPEIAAALARDWALPIRFTGALDGTRGMAVLALAGTNPAELETICRHIPVTTRLGQSTVSDTAKTVGKNDPG